MDKIKLFFHYSYWIILFTVGIMEILSVSSAVYKVGLPLLIIIIFFISIAQNKNYRFPNLILMVLFVIVSIISGIINKISFLQMFGFLAYTISSYFYAVSIINEKDSKIIQHVKMLVIILFIIQIPAAIIKLIIVGQSEKDLIGTVSWGAGVNSSLIPLFVITILFSFYLYNKNKSYIFFVAGFILFGITGNKRVIVYYIPLMVFITYFIYLFVFQKRRTFQDFKLLIFLITFSLMVFVIVVKTNPTLNPEHSRWGSFDLEYVLNYSDQYTTTHNYSKYEMRRKDALIYFWEMILSAKPQRLLLGDGAGKLVQSDYVPGQESMGALYGVRYGGQMAAVWLVLQVGLLGTIIYFVWFLRFVVIVNHFRKNEPLYLAFFSLTVLFLIDSITYSYAFLRFDYLKGVYFLLFALIFRDLLYVENRNNESI